MIQRSLEQRLQLGRRRFQRRPGRVVPEHLIGVAQNAFQPSCTTQSITSAGSILHKADAAVIDHIRFSAADRPVPHPVPSGFRDVERWRCAWNLYVPTINAPTTDTDPIVAPISYKPNSLPNVVDEFKSHRHLAACDS